ncbi:MAG: protein kinase [Polyangiaceae bacterium]
MNEAMEQSVIGDYRLIHQLGEGGMGSVWLAEHVVLGKRFAIKFLLAENANNPDLRARFEQEARAIGRLDHPNVVSATNFGFTSDGHPYLVMEALRGQSLRGLLDQALARTGRPLDPSRAIALIRQACAGIAHAHEHGVIHRDLKPENLFVIQTIMGTDQVKVLDFGIAKIRSASGPMTHKTQTGVVLGTPYYMSYEQARGEVDVDFRTDIYSLAAILYELVSGTRPRDGEHYNAIIADIITRDPSPLDEAKLGLPKGLSELLLRGMNRARELRFQTIAEFESAIGALEHNAIPHATAPASPAQTPATAGAAFASAAANAVDTIYVPQAIECRATTGPTAPATHIDIDGLRHTTKSTNRRLASMVTVAALGLVAAGGFILARWRAHPATASTVELELSAAMVKETSHRTATAEMSSTALLPSPPESPDAKPSLATANVPTVTPIASAATESSQNIAPGSDAHEVTARQHDTTKQTSTTGNSANSSAQPSRTPTSSNGKRVKSESTRSAVKIRIPKNPY